MKRSEMISTIADRFDPESVLGKGHLKMYLRECSNATLQKLLQVICEGRKKERGRKRLV